VHSNTSFSLMKIIIEKDVYVLSACFVSVL